MTFLRILLLATLFAMHALGRAADTGTCCLGADCPQSQCADMGCTPNGPVFAAGHRTVVWPPGAAVEYVRTPLALLPAPVAEIWTPPD